MTHLEISNLAAIRIRLALTRELREMQDRIKKYKEYSTGKGGTDELSDLVSRQYREAVELYRNLPETIRPDQDLLDYEP